MDSGTGRDNREMLKPAVSFDIIELLYVGGDWTISDGYASFTPLYKIYRAYVNKAASPIYLLDTENIIQNTIREYTIVPAKDEDLRKLIRPSELKYLMGRISKEDIRVESVADWQKYLYRPVFRLNEQHLPTFVDPTKVCAPTQAWQDLVAKLLEWECKKDSRIVLVNKATMVKGVKMAYCPHTILCTNSSTGKTTFYEYAGKRLDKYTKNVFLGTARWTNDRFEGLLHQQYLPVCIEQIESQDMENILGFLLSFLELGTATVGAGATQIFVSGHCPLIITANPVGYEEDRISPFRDILSALTKNTTGMGRRFGILVYGNNFATVSGSNFVDRAYREQFSIYRAVEELAYKSMQRLVHDKKVVAWLHQPCSQDYDLSRIKRIADDTVRDFILNHALSGFTHLRGGALNCAMADYMPVLALSTLLDGLRNEVIDTILNSAQEYYQQLITINKESITNLT